MPSSRSCFERKEELFTPSESDCSRHYSGAQTLVPELFLFLHSVQRPPTAEKDHPGLNIDLRTQAVPDRRHMALLTKDSLETRSPKHT